MAVKELTKETLGKTKSGWTWDKKRGVWSTWQVDTHFNGERHIRRGFKSKKETEDYLAQLKMQEKLKDIGVIKLLKFPKVKDLLDKHSATLETPKAISATARIFPKFISILPSPHLTIDELKRKHFKDFADIRIAEGIKAESANREIGEISAAIHKAGDYYENLENWTIPGNLIYRPSFEPTERDRVINADERGRLIQFLLSDKLTGEREKDFIARRRAGLVLYFGLLTGLRHGELCGLKKINFDRNLRKLKVERFKTRKKGVAVTFFEPLTETQLWVITEAEKLYPHGEFFFSEHGKLHNKIYSTLKLHCGKLGIPYGKNIENGFVPHDARHTFITVLEHGSVDSSTTRSFSGHSKDAMMKRYSHATQDSRTRAMQIIENEIGQGSSKSTDEMKRIYDSIKSGKMTLNEFENTVKDLLTVF